MVNRRSGVGTEAKVTGAASGVDLLGAKERSTTLEAGRGREVRFDFRGLPGDSATFRFTARSGADADGVQRALPVRPAYHPRSYTVAGVLRDTATAELRLPDGIDPARSTLALNLGTSPIALIRGARALASGVPVLVQRAGFERSPAVDRSLSSRPGARRWTRSRARGYALSSRRSSRP